MIPQVAISSVAYRSLPLYEMLSKVLAAGFSNVEIWHLHLKGNSTEQWKEVRTKLRGEGLTPVVLSPFTSFTRGKSKESIQTLSQVNAIADLLDCPRIRIFTDVGPLGVGSSEAEERDWDEAVRGIQSACDNFPNIQFLLETHSNTLADDEESCLRLLSSVGRSNLALNLQAIPSFLKAGLVPTFRRLLPYAKHMHWHQVGIDGVGTYIEDPGVIEFEQIKSLILECGDLETLTVEYCWKEVDQSRIPYAAKFLKTIFPI